MLCVLIACTLLHTHIHTHTSTQTYWSITTHMHACAPETWQLCLMEKDKKHVMTMRGGGSRYVWDGGETNWMVGCAAPSKNRVHLSEFPGALLSRQCCGISPQQVHRVSRGGTEVCLQGWSLFWGWQLLTLSIIFAVCVDYVFMNRRRERWRGWRLFLIVLHFLLAIRLFLVANIS